jgi:K+-transporting ATPase ATPase A chain
MVGRTPEYLGKRIEAKEVKMVMLSLVATASAVVLFSAAAFVTGQGPMKVGPHGLSEVLYNNASAAGTNGSAMAGMDVNTTWWNVSLGLEMLVGRFLVLLPALAVAGSLARKGRVAVTSGTMPTHGGFFVGLLLATIVVVTVLTFFPALALGPVAEEFLMKAGVGF